MRAQNLSWDSIKVRVAEFLCFATRGRDVDELSLSTRGKALGKSVTGVSGVGAHATELAPLPVFYICFQTRLQLFKDFWPLV